MDVLSQEAPLPWLVMDRWGIIREVSEAAAALLHMPPAWVIHKPLVSFLPAQERYAFRALLHRLVHGEQPPQWRGYLQPRQRPPLPVILTVSMLPSAHVLQPLFVWHVRQNPL